MGHCSFLLGLSVHKVLPVPSKSLFPQSCVCFGSSIAGLMVTSSKRAYAIPMTNIDSILRIRDITLPTKVLIVKAMVFPVVMYGCESSIKKAEH